MFQGEEQEGGHLREPKRSVFEKGEAEFWVGVLWWYSTVLANDHVSTFKRTCEYSQANSRALTITHVSINSMASVTIFMGV